MIHLRSYPWIYLLQFAVWLLFATCLIAMASFVIATPVSELDLHGKVLPPDWEAAYYNHGKYVRGFPIASYPIWFGAVCLLLLCAFVAQWQLGREVQSQIRTIGADRVRKHKIMHLLFVVGVLVYGWVAMKFVLVGVVPA
jgi:hypothetical protein